MSSCDKCPNCGKRTETHCNVCGEDYDTTLKEHQGSDAHKSFKALLVEIKKLSPCEKVLLYNKYVKKSKKNDDEKKPKKKEK